MKYGILIFIFLYLLGCNSPPLYQSKAREYLTSKGVKISTIIRLTDRKTLSAEEVKVLSQFNHVPTLHLLATNPGANVEILEKLAKHRTADVRWGVATNPKTPFKILQSFRTKGKYSTMNSYLARNPTMPEQVLIEMYQNGEADEVSFALNENCPLSIMQRIAKSESDIARAWLARNPRLPDHLIKDFEQNGNELVRSYLKINPKYKSTKAK